MKSKNGYKRYVMDVVDRRNPANAAFIKALERDPSKKKTYAWLTSDPDPSLLTRGELDLKRKYEPADAYGHVVYVPSELSKHDAYGYAYRAVTESMGGRRFMRHALVLFFSYASWRRLGGSADEEQVHIIK